MTRSGTIAPLFILGFVMPIVAQNATDKPARPPAKSQTIDGYVITPTILKDAGCARDYAKALQIGGLEGRKQLAGLAEYGCIETVHADALYYVAGHLKSVAAMHFVDGCHALAGDVMKEVDPAWYNSWVRRSVEASGSTGGCGYVPAKQLMLLTKEAVVAKLKAQRER